MILFFFFARDPATRTFGLFLISTLAMITIGVIVGIIAGNTAHYRKNFHDHRSRYFLFVLGYFATYNQTNISGAILSNATIFQKNILAKESYLWLPLNERLKRSHSSRKTRHRWLLIEKPVHNRRW